MGCHALLQEIFLIQGCEPPTLNVYLNWQVDSFPLAPPDFQDYVLFRNTLVYEYKKTPRLSCLWKRHHMEGTAHVLTAYT